MLPLKYVNLSFSLPKKSGGEMTAVTELLFTGV